MAELAGADSKLSCLSEADDTKLLERHLSFIRTCGSSGIPTIFDVKNAGTVARFLTAYLVSHVGEWLVTGSNRMRERPIGVLVDALTELGAQIKYSDKEGFLPIRIIGNDIHGGEISIDTSVSSQYVSAILIIGPYLEDGLKMNFVGDQVSRPYITMTVEMMKTFGAHVTLFDDCVVVDPHPYEAIEYQVEPDWTSAAYWYEVAALSKQSDILIPGLSMDSIQGDQVLADLYTHLGVQTKFEEEGIRLLATGEVVKHFSYDFASCSDLALSVITTCAALKVKGTFTGIKNLKYKESDRLKSLAIELAKIGAVVTYEDDVCHLSFSKEKKFDDIIFNTYHDHRLAMSFAPLVLKYSPIQISEPGVVIKSYPSFWEELSKLDLATITETIID
jgi:3-phosphoshikimate 1-carboxyvinyltransferase